MASLTNKNSMCIEEKFPVDSGSSHQSKLENISYAVSQNKNKQDWATGGTVEGLFDYIIVADSHGKCNGKKDLFIKMFSNINWGEYLQNPEWKTILSNQCENIEGIGKTMRIGTTFTCVKIYQEYFEISWIGDSSAKIISYGTTSEPSKSQIIWKTKEHDARNKEDIRVLEEHYLPQKINGISLFKKKFAWDIQATSPTTIENIKSYVFTINSKNSYGIESLNMTRSLGHSGLFNRELGFQTEIIPRKSNDLYKIIAATDGFWPVMCEEDEKNINALLENGASELCSIARKRWEKPWTHLPPDPSQKQDNVIIPKWNHDDIGVAVWNNFEI